MGRYSLTLGDNPVSMVAEVVTSECGATVPPFPPFCGVR